MRQKEFTLQQFIAGCILLGILFLGSFLPKLTLEFDLGKVMMDFYDSHYDEIKKSQALA